jgi:hypothetical protein
MILPESRRERKLTLRERWVPPEKGKEVFEATVKELAAFCKEFRAREIRKRIDHHGAEDHAPFSDW